MEWTPRIVRALRRALRMSQEEFAEYLGASVRTVQNWEGRTSSPVPRHQAALDTALIRLTPLQQQNFDRYVAVDESTTVQQTGLLAPPPSSQEPPANRRDALKAMGVLMVGAVEVMEPPWQKLLAALGGLGDEVEVAAERLEVAAAQDWQTYNYTASSQLIGPVLWRLQVATQLLAQPAAPEIRARLCSLTGEMSRMAGWLFFDLRDHESATQYYHTADEAARQAGDDALKAHIAGCASFLPLVDQRPADALALLRGSDGARLPTTLRSWLAAIRAEAYAHMGEPRACMEALEASSAAMAESETAGMPLSPIFDEARQQGFAGACLIRLEESSQAEEALTSALAGLGPSLSRQRSNVLADLALVRLAQQEVDESCRLLGEALDIAESTRQAVGLSRIRQTRLRLEPYRMSPSVRVLDERLLRA